ncbi:DUF6912 family protein [Cellulomonas oligotrophica]|uniref:Uncharacterized protein n=1 Tax=Cellulomonas oligotrophica TaxID=931536 RepID=A0A7Y9FD59_9CELL|nr:hypothetical protein [Cellulomonas oligotrophica]NYD85181.1 hypothetical protein [Cellulomonas oligotrophica]GIG34156.1 hypothetical protein Col01nite_33150 [Cellulomonas oligotrophica]
MRVYLSTTLDELQTTPPRLAGPRAAHAVTAPLRALWPDEDEEGWEYAAQASAADDSLVLLAGRPGAPRLRLVVAADVPESCVQTPAEPSVPSAVTVTCDVDLRAMAAVHVDDVGAAADVAAAAEGDEAAIGRLDEHDLLWYDLAELAEIPVP